MQNRITGLIDPIDTGRAIEPDITTHPDPATTIPPAQLDAILNDYCLADLPLTELAARHDLPITQLLDILDSPRIAALLDRIASHAHLQAARIAAAAQPLAVNRLRALITTDPTDSRLLSPSLAARHRETTRKAAAQLIRIQNRARSASKGPPPRVQPGNVLCWPLPPGATTRRNSLSLPLPHLRGAVVPQPCPTSRTPTLSLRSVGSAVSKNTKKPSPFGPGSKVSRCHPLKEQADSTYQLRPPPPPPPPPP